MKLTCKLGDFGERIIEVNKEDPLKILFDLLDLRDKDSKFICNGKTWMIDTDKPFKEIGLVSDSIIYVINQAIAGKII